MSQPSYFDEINTLFGTIAEAFALEGDALARALEDGSMTLERGEDQDGNRFVAATLERDGSRRTARIFKDAIHHEGEATGEGTV
ncbi:hypothetical protein CKO38_10225 [Rhodospirillum rubrum]|uniref:hypothetical protein n=1 Tax=Rhodospirillum rubrum TaxID=1085 RepID=UPI0019032691|nr:hypothetical protein [Rhodospirillum rubrum]MBK1665716.1 hypothetical protein [Rhodospirillum rubrum]MBK1677036.1 hypothetical protein [Rhodospirillum rubrum]